MWIPSVGLIVILVFCIVFWQLRYGAIRGCMGFVEVSPIEKVYFLKYDDRPEAERLARVLKAINYFNGDCESLVRVGKRESYLCITFVLNKTMLGANGLDNLFGRLLPERIKEEFDHQPFRMTICSYHGVTKTSYDFTK